MRGSYFKDITISLDTAINLRDRKNIEEEASFYWLCVESEQPQLVFRRWIAENRFTFKKKYRLYPAYNLHEMIEVAGDLFQSLTRSVTTNGELYTASSPSPSHLAHARKPQDAIGQLIINSDIEYGKGS